MLLLHGFSRRDFQGMAPVGGILCKQKLRIGQEAPMMPTSMRAPIMERCMSPGTPWEGLLASAVAISFDAPRLILLAPAFELAIKGMGLTPFIAPFKSAIAMNRPISAADSAYPARSALQPDYWADVLIRPAAQLERLRKACRKNIKRLKSRTLLILGGADRTVSPKVVHYLRKAAPGMASFDSHVIPGADHVFIFNEHSSTMLQLVLEWMTISL